MFNFIRRENSHFWEISKVVLIVLNLLWGFVNETFVQGLFLSSIIVFSIFMQHKINFPLWWRKVASYLLLLSILLIFLFFFLSRQSISFFVYISSLLPYIALLLIVEDIFGQKINEDKFINLKKINKKHENFPYYSIERWKNISFSYNKEMTAVSGLYPRSVYAFLIFISIIGSQIKNDTLNIYTMLFITFCYLFFAFNDFKMLNRKKGFIQYIIFFLFIMAMGYSLNYGLQVLRYKTNEMYIQRMGSGNPNAGWFNVFEQNSQIGETGKINDSQKLLLRIEWKEPAKTLLPAAYLNITDDGKKWKTTIFGNKFIPNNAGSRDIPSPLSIKATEIYNKNQSTKYDLKYMNSIVPLQDPGFKQVRNERSAVLIGRPLSYKRGETALPIPSGTKILLGADDARITAFANGSLMFSGFAGEVNIQTLYDKSKYINLHAPVDEDLTIPETFIPVIKNIIIETGIKDSDSVEIKVEKLHNWYYQNFKYSLELGYNGKPKTIKDFLTHARQGHCEYFASTSTMILRYLGIPTRYATGFLVQEKHEEEELGMYWVRQRDSHAWSVYWDGKGWQSIDNTPPMENAFYEDKNWKSNVEDFLESLQYKIGKMSLNDEAMQQKIIPLFVGLLVLVLLLFILFTRKKWKKINMLEEHKEKNIINEMDKNFEMEMLEYTMNNPRMKNEPWGIWAERIKNKEASERIRKFYEKRY